MYCRIIFSSAIVFCGFIIIISQAEKHTVNSPSVILYSNNNGGNSFKSVARNYPDLSQVDFDNKAKSACILGTWIFYENKNFTNFTNGVKVQHSKTNGCFIFGNLSSRVSSIRFAGSARDYRQDFIDLFSGIFFTEAHLRSGLPSTDLNTLGFDDTNSIIVSGTSPWTLYSNTSYSGSSRCIYPKEGGLPRFYRNTLDIGSIVPRSFRKGCHHK